MVLRMLPAFNINQVSILLEVLRCYRPLAPPLPPLPLPSIKTLARRGTDQATFFPTSREVLVRRRATSEVKTGPEEAQYFHVRPPIGFI